MRAPRRLGYGERQAAVATLAAAFHSDPMMRILEPDEENRDAIATWFFERIVAYALHWAEVWAIDDAAAVAVWLPPGSGSMTTSRMLRVGMAGLPWRVGLRGTARFLEAVRALDTLHAAVHGPHWYLPAIGTRPTSEGQGFGSALMRVATDQADAAGIPCYLEATLPANQAFYAKRGFAVTDTRRVGAFTFTGMVRLPVRGGPNAPPPNSAG